MQSMVKPLLPIFIIFFLITAGCFAASGILSRYNINSNVVLGGNIFFLLLTLLSFSIQQRGMQQTNPHAFVRSVMTGMLMKMLLTIAAVMIYVYASGDQFNKKGIFIALLLYLVYLAAEVRIIMKLNRNKNA